ncbi:MAG: sigma-70 family RNA polymerase sigma factor [Polyangiaceae bacterium]|nr:sigma-70 family RNA polymerase sigma factor [Polyangiaceae bacterium]
MTDGLAAEAIDEQPARTSGTVPAGTTATARAWRVHMMVTTHLGFVWRSLRRMGLQAADADDAAQEVFCIADRRLDDIDPEHERSFLFGTALRIVALHRRTMRRRSAHLDALESLTDSSPTPPSPEELTGMRRARSTLDQILDFLPLEERAVFVLYELEELSVPEIAELCSLKVGTTSSRLRRARELFQAAAQRVRARQAFDRGDR